MEIILASKSPRRRELFSLISAQFTVAEADVDEDGFPALPAHEQCAALAELKCRAVVERFPDAAVIGCDTLVELGGNVLGKPADRAGAIDMLQNLSGKEHSVYTGTAICAPGYFHQFTCRTRVRFHVISPEEILEYIDSGDPFDKAGAYGIQGMAARYVSGISGDYFNVMGLPVSALYRALRNAKLV